MSRFSLYREVAHFVKEAIAPSSCVGCKEWGTWLCKDCAADLVFVKEQVCFRCKRLMPGGRTCKRCRRFSDLDGLVVALHYEDGPIREMVHELKYGKLTELAGVMEPWLVLALSEQKMKVDALTAVPLHFKKQYKRGFNQAELLARGVARGLGLKYQNTLNRVRPTVAQAGLTRSERQENMYRAFRPRGVVPGSRYLLIDDVATTGATLDEAARALKDGGARRVWGLVVARG